VESSRILFEYWGRGLLVAAMISAIVGLLLPDTAVILYSLAVLFFLLSIMCLFAGRHMKKEE
jgi:hypothetical protein